MVTRKVREWKAKNAEKISMRLPIMSKNKNSPEHCSLSSPIEWEKDPRIKVDCSSNQCNNHQDIPQSITERHPGILDPAMLGNSSSDLSNLKWRWRTWVEIIFSINPMKAITIPSCILHLFKHWFFHWRAGDLMENVDRGIGCKVKGLHKARPSCIYIHLR